MSLGNPVVLLRGTVRRDHVENVPGNPGNPETRQPARAPFNLRHLTVDTGLSGYSEDAGPADVCFREDDTDFTGLKVAHGEVVEVLARPYIATVPYRNTWRRVVRFALVQVVGQGAAKGRPAAAAG